MLLGHTSYGLDPRDVCLITLQFTCTCKLLYINLILIQNRLSSHASQRIRVFIFIALKRFPKVVTNVLLVNCDMVGSSSPHQLAQPPSSSILFTCLLLQPSLPPYIIVLSLPTVGRRTWRVLRTQSLPQITSSPYSGNSDHR